MSKVKPCLGFNADAKAAAQDAGSRAMGAVIRGVGADLARIEDAVAG